MNAPPVASFTTAVTDLTASFASTSTDPDGNATIVSFAWDFGDTTTGTGAAPSHTYAVAGTYTVTLTVTDDGGLSDTAQATIIVTDPPPVNAPPVASFTSTVTDLTASFASTSTDPDGNATIVSFAWDFGDNTTGTGAAPSHTYTVAGTYTVTLTVTDNGGLSDSVSQAVTVTDPPPPPPPANFTVKKLDLAGGALDLEIRNAPANAAVTVDGLAAGSTDDRGRYKNTIDPFSSTTCVVTIKVGGGSVQDTPSGCIAASRLVQNSHD